MSQKIPSPFDAKLHFGFLTNRVARLAANSMKKYLMSKGFSFPTSCMGVLADLWERDGKTQKEIGLSLVKTKSSITKMLIQLENAGLIYKTENDADKRNKLIFLTSNGRKFKADMLGLSLKMEKGIGIKHSKEEIRIAKEVLGSIYEILQKDS